MILLSAGFGWIFQKLHGNFNRKSAIRQAVCTGSRLSG
jgi:hypothetical protein